ncbi:hypothetical protein Misp01_56970 [Microtetraspora sp. NBRC 13810]|nr:hypothetical protein Misp01_56970 [Microtetraspora sp. NBRC 13810]
MLVTLLAGLFFASPARAEPLPGAPDPDAPRAWSFWQSDGTAWLTAPEAAAETTPADGATVGWRFAASPDQVAAEAPGGDIPVFEQLCKDVPAAEGEKRVVVAVDFGDAEADAYPGETPPSDTPVVRCVSAGEPATALQLLASMTKAGVDATGRVATVQGYPARAAGDDVREAAAPVATEEAGGLPLPLIAGGAALLILLAITILLLTRRRSTV